MLLFRILAATACLNLMMAQPVLARSGRETIKLPETQMRALTIEAVQAVRFRMQKQAVGQLAFNEDTSTVVLTPFAGRVTKVFGKIGDNVAVNAPLFEIDSPEVVQMQTDLIASLNVVEKARSQLALTKRVLDRQVSLVADRAAAMRELDQARADFAAAESDLRTAEGAAAAARNRLRVLVGRTDEDMARIERDRSIDPLVTVRAPIAGQIVSRKIGLGQLVRPDTSEPLFSIADLATMWLRAAVPENDIPMIRVGQELEVHIDALPKSAFKARVTAIGSSSDAVTRRIMVRSELANPDQILRPEMFATFRIFVGVGDMWPAVSSDGIVREANRSFVYVEVRPNEFQRRLVTLGPEQNGRVAVREGIQPGDKVVGRGAIFLDNEWKQ